MASNSRETWKHRLARKAKAGRKRKNKESRNSTPSAIDLFAGMGKPGEAAPKPVKAAPRAAAAPLKAASK
jgi:hypothetical protein